MPAKELLKMFLFFKFCLGFVNKYWFIFQTNEDFLKVSDHCIY